MLASLPLTAPKVTSISWRRLLAPQGFGVGESVEVLSCEEIQLALDDSGALEGVPFMAEMQPHCGRWSRIARRVDKVYDYDATKMLRRPDNSVVLVGLRRDGANHGVCRYTQIVAAPVPLSCWDVRQDLRPLLAGNVTILAFAAALLAWLLNGEQGFRGRIPFPDATNGGQSRTPADAKNLAFHDQVRVPGSMEIGKTLDAENCNCELRFDREMIRHCHPQHALVSRVDRIIDDVTGRMVRMKTLCILLHDMVATGEFLRYGAQQEYLLWREVWPNSETPRTVEYKG